MSDKISDLPPVETNVDKIVLYTGGRMQGKTYLTQILKDHERMEFLSNHGFSIWQIIDNGVESWRCQYKIDEQHEGKTLREAMDKAIIAYRKENQNETDSNYHNNIGRPD